jgi:hypothetical protein
MTAVTACHLPPAELPEGRPWCGVVLLRSVWTARRDAGIPSLMCALATKVLLHEAADLGDRTGRRDVLSHHVFAVSGRARDARLLRHQSDVALNR